MARPSPYVRPFGNAPWNIPVDYPIYTYPWYTHLVLGHPVNSLQEPYGKDGIDYAGRLYNFKSNTTGNFNLRFRDYTYPVYYVEDADDTYTVVGGNANINGTEIPWNSIWTAASPTLTSRTGTNSDAQVIVIDEATGKEWDLWRVFPDTVNKIVYIQGGSIVGTEVQPSVPGNVTGNIWTKENGWVPSRGAGIPYLAMLVQPEEIVSGEITHALSMPIKQPSNRFYLPPATKLEHPESPENPHPVPEGMRFCLYPSATGHATAEDAVDAWILARHSSKTQAIKDFARIVGLALYKYGWFVTDTSGAAGFQFESEKSATTQWNALGINPASTVIQDLIDGLIVGATYNSTNDTYSGGNIATLTLPACYGIYDVTFGEKVLAAVQGFQAANVYTTAQGFSS